MNDDEPTDSRLAELLRLAEDMHESFAGKPEMERAAAFAVLAVKHLIANDDAAAGGYIRILQAIVTLERTDPEPGEKLH